LSTVACALAFQARGVVGEEADDIDLGQIRNSVPLKSLSSPPKLFAVRRHELLIQRVSMALRPFPAKSFCMFQETVKMLPFRLNHERFIWHRLPF
jgi:hypothetical protein